MPQNSPVRTDSGIQAEKHIISTGGSAVYGAKAMEHLRRIGTVVYLQLAYEELEKRLGDLQKRGVVLRPGFTLKDLYEERIPLYEKYADITIACDGKDLRQVVEEIALAV